MVVLHEVEALTTGGDILSWENVPQVAYEDSEVILTWPGDPYRVVSIYLPNHFYVDVDRREINIVRAVE